MILQMHEIINFSQFYTIVKLEKLPFKVLYKLDTLTRAIEEKTGFYFEQLQELINEYGQKDENGNIIQTDDGQGVKLIPEKTEECNSKLNELQILEVELPDIKFDIEDFGNIELTMDTFNIIRPFLN